MAAARVVLVHEPSTKRCGRGMPSEGIIVPRGLMGPEGSITPVVLEEKINAVKRLAVSTGQLKPLLVLHTRPIDLVVFQEPSLQSSRRPRLAEGFTLICLQRLSWPYVTTLRCR